MSLDPSDMSAVMRELRDVVEQSEERTRRTIGEAKADMIDRVAELDKRVNGRLGRTENRVSELELDQAKREGAEQARAAIQPVPTSPGRLLTPPADDEPRGATASVNLAKVITAGALLLTAIAGVISSIVGVPHP